MKKTKKANADDNDRKFERKFRKIFNQNPLGVEQAILALQHRERALYRLNRIAEVNIGLATSTIREFMQQHEIHHISAISPVELAKQRIGSLKKDVRIQLVEELVRQMDKPK